MTDLTEAQEDVRERLLILVGRQEGLTEMATFVTDWRQRDGARQELLDWLDVAARENTEELSLLRAEYAAASSE